ncbi:MAG TPA: rhomboid family intramembrane serine protease [Solirubrobacteraceae bacterium]|nr:rhomboid family intramembrane serine protease [Solirubrobacteraceae bacterium]
MIPLKDNVAADRFPLVTLALIIANFVVYILAIRHGGSFIQGPTQGQELKYGAIPFALTHPGVHCAEVVRHTVSGTSPPEILCNTRLLNANGIAAQNLLPSWETVFTGMFMHASIIHIGGNMLFLWIFGNNVEDALGRFKYLAFYLVSGIAALALQVAVAPNSTAPTLGASGAIAGVLGAYIVLYPRARVLTLVLIIFFFTVIEIPAYVMLGIWFAIQAVFGATGLTTASSAGGGVAYFAHIGGFVFGLLVIRLLVRRRKEVPPPQPVY